MIKSSLVKINKLLDQINNEVDLEKKDLLLRNLYEFLDNSFKDDVIINDDFEKKDPAPSTILDLEHHCFHSIF